MPSRKNRDDDDRLAGGDVHPGQDVPGAALSNAEVRGPGPGLAEPAAQDAGEAAGATLDAEDARDPGHSHGPSGDIKGHSDAAHGPSGDIQERSRDPHDRPSDTKERRRNDVPPAWLRTSAVVLGSALLLVLLLVIAAATLPTWWAQTVGRQVDGVPAAGTLWGLFYGVTFTLIPLLLAVVALRVRRS